MRARLKWLIAGVGVMYALQLVILLGVRHLVPHTGPYEFYSFVATVVYTLFAFLAGGFVIGLLAERTSLMELVLAAVMTLSIDMLSTQSGVLQGMFLFSIAFQEAAYGTAMVIGAIAVVAAIAGGLAGEHLALPLEDWTGQVFLATGLGGTLLGPFLMIVSHLPRTYAVLLGVTLAVGVVIVSRRLQRRRFDVREISIYPGRQRSSR